MKRQFHLPSSRETLRNDMDHELAFHLQGRIDDLMNRGMTREEATAEAQKLFGNRKAVEAELEQLDRALHRKKAFRETVEDVLRDAQLAARSLIRRPAFGITVVLTLALGIGANTAIFSVADVLLFRPPPYPHSEELVSVWGASAGEYFALRELTHSFRSVAAYSEWAMNVGDATNTSRADGADVSDNFFSTLGVRPEIGRDFAVGANAVGAPREVMLSYSLWRSQFGSDTSLVGKAILIEGVPRTVIGVMPEDFHFPLLGTKLWFNSTFNPANTGNHWGWYKFKFLARMRAGQTVAQSQLDLRSAAQGMRKLNPVWDPGPKYGLDASVTPLQSQLAGSARTTMLVLLGVVLALLLIACANVANLVLVRSAQREREFAVRAALGCSRLRLARQLLTENIMLSAVGGVAALVFAALGVRLLADALPPQIPRTAPIAVDARVLVFTALLAILTGLAVGLVPAFRAARSVRSRGLTDLRGASHGVQHTRSANILTVVQLALAVILIAGSGLLLRSFDALRQANTGFSTQEIASARVTLPNGLYRTAARCNTFVDALLVRLRESTAITSIAVIDRPPLRGPVYGMGLRVAGQFEDFKNALPTIEHVQAVSADYFSTMGIHLLRGRAFTAADGDSAPPVAIISQSVAKRFWPNSDAIGQRIGAPFASPWITVVGVVAEVQQDSLNGKNEATVYRPFAQAPQPDLTIVARTRGSIADFSATLKNAVNGLDKLAPVSDVRPMSDVVATSFARARFTAFLLTGFALLALIISAVGVYGVVASTVTQRSREMGVRMALGATPSQVLRHVMMRGTVLAVVGVLTGLVGAVLSARFLTGLLYGVTAIDTLTFSVAPMLLIAVGLLATWLPARRVVRTSPVVALNTE